MSFCLHIGTHVLGSELGEVVFLGGGWTRGKVVMQKMRLRMGLGHCGYLTLKGRVFLLGPVNRAQGQASGMRPATAGVELDLHKERKSRSGLSMCRRSTVKMRGK